MEHLGTRSCPTSGGLSRFQRTSVGHYGVAGKCWRRRKSHPDYSKHATLMVDLTKIDDLTILIMIDYPKIIIN